MGLQKNWYRSITHCAPLLRTFMNPGAKAKGNNAKVLTETPSGSKPSTVGPPTDKNGAK